LAGAAPNKLGEPDPPSPPCDDIEHWIGIGVERFVNDEDLHGGRAAGGRLLPTRQAPVAEGVTDGAADRP